jgi:hypothetical protein
MGNGGSAMAEPSMDRSLPMIDRTFQGIEQFAISDLDRRCPISIADSSMISKLQILHCRLPMTAAVT